MNRSLRIPALTFALSIALVGCGSASSDQALEPSAATATASSGMTSDASGSAAPSPTTPAEDSDAMSAAAPGAYLSFEEYENSMVERSGSTVVLFFHADWCPSCRATDESLTTDGVPDGLTVVKVDYDTETELRQRYGVTTQHTFVRVDESGAELAKWTGSASGADIAAQAG